MYRIQHFSAKVNRVVQILDEFAVLFLLSEQETRGTTSPSSKCANRRRGNDD